MPTPISYTFPNTANIPAIVRGKTLTDGVPDSAYDPQIKRLGRFVRFDSILIDGKPLFVRLTGRPELEAAVVTYEAETAAEEDAARAARRDKLEAAVPGVHALIELSNATAAEDDRYHHQLERAMDQDDNRWPRPLDKSLRQRLNEAKAANPRAALYVQAKRQADHSHWADNTGTGAAGRKAMDILAAGGTMEDATAALAERREWTD